MYGLEEIAEVFCYDSIILRDFAGFTTSSEVNFLDLVRIPFICIFIFHYRNRFFEKKS